MPEVSGDQRITGLGRVRSGREVRWNGCRTRGAGGLLSCWPGVRRRGGCQLAGGTVVSPGTVASLLDETLIERVVFAGPSRVIDLGRARGFTGAVHHALEVRDQQCTHHNCDQPPERCQGDHIHAWAAGGTTLEYGQLRCGYHNRWRWQHPDPDSPPEPGPGVDPDLRQRIAHLEQWRVRLRATLVAEQAADTWRAHSR
jgi:hypothetical protein